MELKEKKLIKSVLNKYLKNSWFPFFIKCLVEKNAIFKKTHWSKEKGIEAKFAKRLSLTVAIYNRLEKIFNEKKAFKITSEIVIPTGCSEQIKNTESLNVSNKEPMEQLLSFYGFMGISGVGRFVDRKLIKANNDFLHYEVRNCFFSRFYYETDTPELTKLFCLVDNEFFPRAFPDFKFHRGDSIENTMAYGKKFCTFKFEGNR